MSGAKYTIKASRDGVNYLYMASFDEGQDSRFNKPFDDEVAIMEAKSFKYIRGDEFPYVKLVIQI